MQRPWREGLVNAHKAERLSVSGTERKGLSLLSGECPWLPPPQQSKVGRCVEATQSRLVRIVLSTVKVTVKAKVTFLVSNKSNITQFCKTQKFCSNPDGRKSSQGKNEQPDLEQRRVICEHFAAGRPRSRSPG